MNWTTRFPAEHTRRFGVEEIHNVYFAPIGWPGKGTTLCLLIPECELQYCMVAQDGEPIALVNRPQKNKKIKHWLRFACQEAMKNCALLSLACDTADDAERYAKQAAKLLSNYQRIAMERMYEPESRALGNLN
jgi:hypothetical protein